ncbi:MAG: hypothetical protein HN403_17010 [Rhodospirillales bacterium]|jgi:hypothetical protein|nr:hypothetical protein [Rhodospirillales bacterium]
MTEPGMDLLMWARGTGFQIAIGVFLFGVALRLVEIFALGRKADVAPAKGDAVSGGFRTIFSRFVPAPGFAALLPVQVIGGTLFHFGLLFIVFFFIPHIAVIKDTFGLSWPGISSAVINALTVVTFAILVVLLVVRLRHPVRRYLSDFQDYLIWVLTVLPLVTGYMAFNAVGPYIPMLATHVLSAELLIALIPFTRLTHAFTWVSSRYYNGAFAGRKGTSS